MDSFAPKEGSFGPSFIDPHLEEGSGAHAEGGIEEAVVIADELPPGEDLKMPGCPAWMVTFGDAISLLMTFFVLILSFSAIDPSQMSGMFAISTGGGGGITVVGGEEGSVVTMSDGTGQHSAGSGGGGDSGMGGSGGGGGGGGSEDVKHVEKKIDAKAVSVAQDSSYAMTSSYQEMATYFAPEGETGGSTSVSKQEGGGGGNAKIGSFRVSFDQNMAFSTGRAFIRSESRKHINKIGTLLSELPNDILITCYATDFNRIPYPEYPSNLELSLERATTIADIFVRTFDIAAERIGVQVVREGAIAAGSEETAGTAKAQVAIHVLSDFDGFKRVELKKYELQRRAKFAQ